MIVDTFAVQIRHSRRARHIRLRIIPDGVVMVTVPFGVREAVVERVVREKRAWIVKHLHSFSEHTSIPPIRHTPAEYRKVKEQARTIITSVTERYARVNSFQYRSITIRNQSTRWGSCSKQGNLSFSYRLLFLPNDVRDYVIVHELCHLREMNHGPAFWRLVERILPDFRQRRATLRTYRLV